MSFIHRAKSRVRFKKSLKDLQNFLSVTQIDTDLISLELPTLNEDQNNMVTKLKLQ